MKMILLKITGIMSASIWSSFVMAAEQSTQTLTAKTLTTPPVSTSALVETLFGLIMVLACIAFLAWLIRRTGHFNSSANGKMKIITSIALGPRERAVLLQVGEQQILLGVTTQNVQTLHILDTPVSTSDSSSAPHSNFADKLKQSMQQRVKS